MSRAPAGAHDVSSTGRFHVLQTNCRACAPIGGIISSTVLTLLVLPALYVLFRRDGAGETPTMNRDLARAASEER
jgi:hypothetical protein